MAVNKKQYKKDHACAHWRCRMLVELELYLECLEHVPYKHSNALIFLSYLIYHPEVVHAYPEIVALALDFIKNISQTRTDEPAILAYQIPILLSYLTHPPLPQWTGIPQGDTDKVAWKLFQYYPFVSAIERQHIQQWSSQQLLVHRKLSYDVSVILQYMAYQI